MDEKMEDTITQKIADEKESSPTPDESAELAPRHREYLLERHGTLELDPVPYMDDADPYNWPSWRVCTVLSSCYCVVVRAMLTMALFLCRKI